MAENQYSIKDLENFTQIKSHTIRIWEQRYKLLQPSRTEGNRRFYSDTDLKKILNINTLYNHGIKISKIAQMSEEEIVHQCKAIIFNKSEKDGMINEMIQHIIKFDRYSIDKILIEQLSEQDLEALYLQKILPMLQKMGELWQVNTINVIHEHFFSYLFREQLVSAINKLQSPQKDAPRALLFLPDHEEHEFGLLMYYYFLKKRGYSCIYLGQKVPFKEIINAYKTINPTLVITTFTTKIKLEDFQNILDGLVQIAKSANVLISGAQVTKMEIKIPSTIKHIEGIQLLDDLLKEL